MQALGVMAGATASQGQDVAYLLIAMRPDLLVPLADYQRELSATLERIKAIPNLEFRVLDYNKLTGNGIIHAKYLIVDRATAFVGSQNFDWRSFTHIHETGLRITEPAADLAAAAALVSSLSGSPLPSDTVYFGEVGLSGAIRPVTHAGARLKEAAKLGFSGAVAPAPRGDRGETPPVGLASVATIADLVAGVAAPRRPMRSVAQRGG